MFSNEELIVIREAIRPLDCGHHYCRYCRAQSPAWEHSEHCPYARSLRIWTEAGALLDRAQRELARGDHD